MQDLLLTKMFFLNLGEVDAPFGPRWSWRSQEEEEEVTRLEAMFTSPSRPADSAGPPKNVQVIALLFMMLVVPASQQWHKDGLEEVKCPAFIDHGPPCSCEASTDGLDFKCTTEGGKRPANFADVSAILSAAR